MAFSLKGKLFNFVQAKVFIFSPFGDGNIMNVRFSVTSCLTSIASKVALEVSNIIKHGAEVTAKTLQAVRTYIKSAGSWYQHAFQKMKKWNFILERKERSIQRKAYRLSIIQNYLESSCVDLCPEVCVGGPTTNANCKNVLGKWFPCPEWDSCKSKIEDSLCIARCVGKKVYYEGKALRKRNAVTVLNDGIIVIKRIMDQMKFFVIQAKQLQDMTQKTALNVKELSIAGQNAISQISNFSKEKLIEVRRLCFNTSLEKASSSCLRVGIDVLMGGKKEYLFGTQICINARFTEKLSNWIADQLFPGISMIDSKINEADVNFKSLKQKIGALSLKAFDSEKLEKKLQSEIEEIADQDDEVEVTKQGEKEKARILKMSDENIRHQVYGYSPSVQIQDDYIMEAFEKKSPWAFSHRDSPFILRKGTGLGDVEKDTLSLDIMALEDPGDTSKCSPTQSVVNTYSMMADTIDVLVQKAEEERSLFDNAIKMYTKGADETEEEIVNNCKALNMTEERTNDALFYIRKVKNGTDDWMKTVTRQIEFQDKEALEMWRKSFVELMSTNKNLDIPKFLEILNSVALAAKGRHDIPTTNQLANEFIVKFTVATKVVNELLVGELGSLSSKKESIQNFVEAARFLKRKMRIDCAT